MTLDILLILLIAAVIALSTLEGLMRSAFMLLSFYILTMLVGGLIAGLNVAQALGNTVISALGRGPTTPRFYQGLLFLSVLIVAWAISVIMIRMALQDAKIEMLGWGDPAIATLIGIVLALVMAAVVCNAWGVIVVDRWQPNDTWLAMRTTFESSALRSPLMGVLRVYRRTLFPFASFGYPVFLVPQG